MRFSKVRFGIIYSKQKTPQGCNRTPEKDFAKQKIFREKEEQTEKFFVFFKIKRARTKKFCSDAGAGEGNRTTKAI